LSSSSLETTGLVFVVLRFFLAAPASSSLFPLDFAFPFALGVNSDSPPSSSSPLTPLLEVRFRFGVVLAFGLSLSLDAGGPWAWFECDVSRESGSDKSNAPRQRRLPL